MALMHRPVLKEHPPVMGALLDTANAVVNPTSSLRQVRRQLAANNAERQTLLRNLSHYNSRSKRSLSS